MNNRNELFTLLVLRENKAFTRATAMTIKEMLTGEMLQIKPSTLYMFLQRLVKAGFVGKGLPDGHAATYYITNAGVDKIGEFDEQ